MELAESKDSEDRPDDVREHKTDWIEPHNDEPEGYRLLWEGSKFRIDKDRLGHCSQPRSWGLFFSRAALYKRRERLT
jgi:hypothetical protein